MLTEPALHSSEPADTRSGAARGVAVVIDDDPMVLHGLALVLGQLGWRVLAAESGEQALAMVAGADARPDVIIADYRLRDGRTGIDAIQAVRGVVDRGVPALLLTGETSPDRLREARCSGFTVLHKPVTFRELLNHLAPVFAA